MERSEIGDRANIQTIKQKHGDTIRAAMFFKVSVHENHQAASLHTDLSGHGGQHILACLGAVCNQVPGAFQGIGITGIGGIDQDQAFWPLADAYLTTMPPPVIVSKVMVTSSLLERKIS